MMEYKASCDVTTLLITGVVSLLFALIIFNSVRALIVAPRHIVNTLIHSLIILVLFVLLAASYLGTARYYSVDATNLTICRYTGNEKIKLSDIQSARTLSAGEMEGTVRTNGNGGLFGYTGQFFIPKIGSTTFYATQRRNRVLITAKYGRNFVITPDDTTIVDKLKRKVTAPL